MRKIIAAINLTADGFCDHDVITPGEEIHQHYTELLQQAGVILYGRKTFRLMEYWKQFVENPSGVKDMDEFAAAMDAVPKVVFSHLLAVHKKLFYGRMASRQFLAMDRHFAWR